VIGDRVLLITASALFGFRLLLALTLIPPWQQPDEPYHVGLVELQRARLASLDDSPDPAHEREILRSMRDYDWWRHRGLEVPATFPETFVDAGRRVVVDVRSVTRPPTYYLIAGRVLGWFPQMTVLDDLYVLRGLSAAVAMLTFWVGWLGARESLGAPGGATVAVILALHPQFAVASTAASPDALVNFLGACVWWQTAVAVRRTQLLRPLAVIWIVVIAAASSDRVAVPLLAVAFVVSVAVTSLRAQWQGTELFAAAVRVTTAALTFALAVWAIDWMRSKYALSDVFSGGVAPVPDAFTWNFFARFTSFLFQSWWLSLGWIRYLAPGWWTLATVLLTVFAGIGVTRRLIRERELETRALLSLAVVTVGIQLFALYWLYFRNMRGAQGKSLFPLLLPSIVLLWAGLEVWVPKSCRVYVAVALVVLLSVLESAVWLLVAIPAYI
jgi:hypothetical protein